MLLLSYNLVLKFVFNFLFNIEISKPPNLKIWGFFTKLIIVDSTPTFDLPPSRINLIFFPNSSYTSSFVTGLIPSEIFALGAAKGYFKDFNNILAVRWLGNLTPNVFLLFVKFFEILLWFFSFNINVIGPGHN